MRFSQVPGDVVVVSHYGPREGYVVGSHYDSLVRSSLSPPT